MKNMMEPLRTIYNGPPDKNSPYNRYRLLNACNFGDKNNPIRSYRSLIYYITCGTTVPTPPAPMVRPDEDR